MVLDGADPKHAFLDMFVNIRSMYLLPKSSYQNSANIPLQRLYVECQSMYDEILTEMETTLSVFLEARQLHHPQ